MTTGLDSFQNNWYNIYRFGIPTIDSKDFAKFAAGCKGFTHPILGSGTKIQFDIKDSPAAYADREHNTVVLPKWYLSEEGLSEFKDAGELQNISIALINGSTIHEQLHFKFSPKNLSDFFATPRGEQILKTYGKMAEQMANVVEDIYIEKMVETLRGCERLASLLSLKNNILFSVDALEEALAKTKPTKQLSKVTNLFVFMKNNVNYFATQYNEVSDKVGSRLFDHLVNIINRPTEYRNLSDRQNFVFTLIEMCDPDPEGERSEGSDGGEGEGYPTPAPEQKLTAKAAEKAEVEGKKDEKLDGRVESFKAATTIAKDDPIKVKGLSGLINRVREFDVLQVASSRTRIEHKADKNFSFLSTLLRLQTKNRVPGEAKVRGTQIINQKLYRIGIDGKMFTNKTATMDKQQKAEIIFLIDASGSMGQWADYDRRVSLFSAVVGIVHQLHDTLRKAGIANAVYAHTSMANPMGGDGYDVPILIHVSSFQMQKTTTDVENRFSQLMKIELVENYDGFAIEAAAKHFTPRDSKKIMIVLSDGQPEGPEYHWTSAKNHTKEVISKVRKSGTAVISMSLVADVINTNDELYGKEFNIDGSKNLQKEFERVITQIQASLK